jgi:D-serine deaminase-like pyridoxal phosphate-dependent protein
VAEATHPYLIRGLASVLTPALAIYPHIVEYNISTTLKLLDGDAGRWRPHIKTIKLGRVMRMLVQQGVTNFKCATTLELLTACKAGALDVLLAMPVVGATARRVAQIASSFPEVAVSALLDAEAQIDQWKGSRIGVFVDINPGMNRTGISETDSHIAQQLATRATEAGLKFRGLHYYDGHLRQQNFRERTKMAHAGYDRLVAMARALAVAGLEVKEVITSGTPAFPCTLSYEGFRGATFVHRVSPGTLIYGDLMSQAQLPSSFGYQMAVLVVSRVISQPLAHGFTCDAGHKAVSVDSGVPNCAVYGWDHLIAGAPSEEHLPFTVPDGTSVPQIGEILYLFPKHVCPTVNNFSDALFVKNHEIAGMERVDARGREAPIPAV